MITKKRYETMTPKEIMDSFHNYILDGEKVFENKPSYNKEMVWYESTHNWMDYMETEISEPTLDDVITKVENLDREISRVWFSLSDMERDIRDRERGK